MSPLPRSLKGMEAQSGKVTFVGAHSPSGELGLGLCLSSTKARASFCGMPGETGWVEGLEGRQKEEGKGGGLTLARPGKGT